MLIPNAGLTLRPWLIPLRRQTMGSLFFNAPLPDMIRKFLVAVSLLGLVSCASANKRIQQGQELQRAGRPAEAADKYIDALEKDQKLDSARVGLRTAGADAIAGWLRSAADPNTSASRAADLYLQVDDLEKRALDVGIYLVLPNDYEQRKRASFDKGIDAALMTARQLTRGGQYADAVSVIGQAATSYHPSDAQARSLGTASADVALAWARSDTAAGRFRSADARLDQIANLPGATQAQIDDARALQDAALARGTKKVAIVPAWATTTARFRLPEDALPSLGDALRENPWISPPRFVSLAAPDEVERDLRRSGLARHTLSTYEAARFARGLGADWVVVTEIDSVSRSEYGVRITRHPARTNRGADTAYFTEEGQARIYTHGTFVVIDREGQRVTDYLGIDASGDAPFTRVRFAGDYRTLALRQSERDLFERGFGDRDIVHAFVQSMSPRLSNAVYTELVRRIP